MWSLRSHPAVMSRPSLIAALSVGLVAGLLVGRRGAAQQAPVTFVYLRGADTLATEMLTPGSGQVKGVLSYKGQPRLEWEQTPAPLRLSLSVFPAGSGADAPPLQMATFVAEGDSMVAELGLRGAMRPQRFASKAGAVPLINSSLLQTALLVNIARDAGQRAVPVFLTQGAQTIEGTLSDRGDTTTFTLAGMAMHIVRAAGAVSEVRVPAQNLRAVRAGGPVRLPAPVPVSYDAPADAPYTAESVTVPTPGGFTLAGTLTIPRDRMGRVPVVVTISGSGPQDRDSRIPIVKDYAPFRDIADTLGRRGIAVLRYDDRGVGRSGGRETRDSATSADFADDVLAVVAYLRTRPEVDPARIAVVGHSEGGLIAPLAAVRDPRLAAVVLLAGPAHDGRRILMYQNANAIQTAPGLTPAQRDSLLQTVPAALDSLARTSRWMRHFLTTDPLVTARAVRQPVLILQGDTDRQVTADQAEALAAAIRAAGNPRVALHRFPATNHLFLADPSGAPAGYATLTDTRVRPEVLGTLADWLARTLQ